MRASTPALTLSFLLSTLLLLLPSNGSALSLHDTLNFFGKRSVNTSPTSNMGGYSKHGSGPQPSISSYEGQYGLTPIKTPKNPKMVYIGGGSIPYKCGAKSPGGIHGSYNPTSWAAGIWGTRSDWPEGWWEYEAGFGYTTRYNKTSKALQSFKVICVCKAGEESSCEKNYHSDYVKALLGTGTWEWLESHSTTLLKLDNTFLYVNGSLPNGTTVKGAAAGGRRGMAETAFWWMIAGVVAAGMFSL